TDIFKQKWREAAESVNSLVCNFKQTKYFALLDEQVASEGRFFYGKEGRIRLEYRLPAAYDVVFNGNRMKIVADGKTTVYDAGKNRMAAHLNRLIIACLTGRPDELTPEYAPIFTENRTQYRVELHPSASRRSQVGSVEILLDKKDFAVKRLTMTDSSDDRTVYVFTEMQKNISVDHITFDIP
ncbi:MAG: outer membrane lipoprotein carrier protein LolA, partial [Bacteroidales bacterium]|nr:outer membrane lipoprotein carrier protein LolA [Bacteroidales bacterium]